MDTAYIYTLAFVVAVTGVVFFIPWFRKHRRVKKAKALYLATCVHVLGKPAPQNRADKRKLAAYIRRGVYR